MMQRELSAAQIENEVAQHVANFRTGVMASLDHDGIPYTSVVPVIKQGHRFYAYLSETAPHYEFIQKSAGTDLMFAEDEADMQSSFLRKRVSYRLKASFVPEQDSIVQAFEKVHGDMVHTIRKMDFHLVEFTIQRAKAIFGAGQAYFLNEREELIGQDTGTGRGHEKKA